MIPSRLVRLLAVCTLCVFSPLGALLASSADAQAATRFGVQGQWFPAVINTNEGTYDDAEREVLSLGVGAFGLFGADLFSLGFKVNYTMMDLEADVLDYSHVDANAMVRVGLPASPMALWGEVGPSFAMDYDGVGYNVGAGLLVDVLAMPMVELNLGLGGQYVSLPLEKTGFKELKTEELRLMVVLGFGISL